MSDSAAQSAASTWRRWLRIGILVLLIIVLLGCLLVVGLRTFGVSRGLAIPLVALTPYVFVVALVGLVVAGLIRSWVPAGLFALCAALVAWWWVPAFVGKSIPAERPGPVVMTANLRFGQANPEQIVNLVRENHIQILAVEELTPSAIDGLQRAGLSTLLPNEYLNPRSAAAGSGIYSSLTLTDRSQINGTYFPTLVAKVQFGAQPVTVIVVHPVAPRTSPSFDSWRMALQQIANYSESVSGAVVMLGDFNATRDHEPFRAIEAKGYTDAATVYGAGLFRTWSTVPVMSGLPAWPFVGIDHVLERNTGWGTPTKVTAYDVSNTDHRSVVVSYAA